MLTVVNYAFMVAFCATVLAVTLNFSLGFCHLHRNSFLICSVSGAGSSSSHSRSKVGSRTNGYIREYDYYAEHYSRPKQNSSKVKSKYVCVRQAVVLPIFFTDAFFTHHSLFLSFELSQYADLFFILFSFIVVVTSMRAQPGQPHPAVEKPFTPATTTVEVTPVRLSLTL